MLTLAASTSSTELSMGLIELAKFIPLMPLLAMVACLICLMFDKLRNLAAIPVILASGAALVLTFLVFTGMGNPEGFKAATGGAGFLIVEGFTWIHIGEFTSSFNFYIDNLTILMLFVVYGVGTVIVIYAAGYMKGDDGYARFFTYISLFILSMTMLVMGDNLLVLYLGWEGVGVASFLLIGYYYRKGENIAAAKKAFITNRVGDLGFALGLMGVFVIFGTINYAEILPAAQQQLAADGKVEYYDASKKAGHGKDDHKDHDHADHNDKDHSLLPTGIHASDEGSYGAGDKKVYYAKQLDFTDADGYQRGHQAEERLEQVIDERNATGVAGWEYMLLMAIPFLLMAGAFGKSAQVPLHVWLPDAMAGPTPVSALMHAATMVTAGVFMIGRLYPIFQLNEHALFVVAIVGAVTATFAALVALCQYDLKKIWAYSTCSQLGYMFLGLGVLDNMGAFWHLFTHAFFKALLFLTAGSVMHALAGQLDLRKISGLRKKMPFTAILMLIGCLALAGFPLTAGWFSKDHIINAAWNYGDTPIFGIVGIIVAVLTAFYTFRLWFSVFMGPEKYEMGNEHHGYEMEHGHGHGHDEHGHDAEHAEGHGDDHGHDDHHHDAHEMPLSMNLPLLVLAVGAIAFGAISYGKPLFDMIPLPYLIPIMGMEGWVMNSSASAVPTQQVQEAQHHTHYYIMGVVTVLGLLAIALAAVFYWFCRPIPTKISQICKPIVNFLNNRMYIDHLYHYAIVMTLRLTAWFSKFFDRLVIDALFIDGLFAFSPRALGSIFRKGQSGVLQAYALSMAFGMVVLMALLFWMIYANLIQL